MKLRLLIWLLAMAMMASLSAKAEDGGFVFGVKSGGTVQTSYVGLESGRFVFFGGLDVLAIGVKDGGPRCPILARLLGRYSVSFGRGL